MLWRMPKKATGEQDVRSVAGGALLAGLVGGEAFLVGLPPEL